MSTIARGRRLLLAVFAVMLGVLVISNVPAGAANTSAENLYDDDEDAETPLVRQYAGDNRYATAIDLAASYTDQEGTSGVALIASGESIVDAAAAAGLAGAEQAPVLLTQPNRLSRNVRNFIEDESISEVYILGGTSAVSADVEDDLVELLDSDSVTRLAGDDRYETSAEIATQVGNQVGNYCDTTGGAAILVNGDESLSDVISAGPVAFADSLPILLTRSNQLPASVADALETLEVAQVVIIGGTAAVSNSVATDAEDIAGDVIRITGDNRFDTAIQVYEALTAKDCTEVEVDSTRFALVNSQSVADGVASSPLLGEGVETATDSITSVLLVNSDGLPEPTREFLAALPIRNADQTYVNVRLTAIGGEAVVPASVMTEALTAARTSDPLTATITASSATGANTMATIEFSSVVESGEGTATARTGAEFKGHYTVNGYPLANGDSVVLNGRTVALTLADNDTFKAGDVIALAGGMIRGVSGDERRVEAATFTVPAVEADNTRPRVSVFAAEGAHEIRIEVEEPNLSTTVADFISNFPGNVLLNNAELTVSATAVATDAKIKDGSTATSITVCLFGDDDTEDFSTTAEACTGSAAADVLPRDLLKTGDFITVGAEAFSDAAGNSSRSSIARVVSNNATAPAVVRATVTEATVYDENGPIRPLGMKNATWSWTASTITAPGGNEPSSPAPTPAPTVGDGTGTNADPLNFLTLTAKSDGVAAGAAGNLWALQWFAAEADADTVQNTTISFQSGRRLIRIVVDDDSNLFAVVTALLENEDVTDNFSISSDVLAYSGNTDINLNVANALGSTYVQDEDEDGAPQANANGAAGPLVAAADSTNTTAANIRRNFVGGESTVTMTLIYNDILEAFNYRDTAGTSPANSPTAVSLIGANRTSDNDCSTVDGAAQTGFPPFGSDNDNAAIVPATGAGPITAGTGWQTDVQSNDANQSPAGNVLQTLTREITIVLHSKCLGDLPVDGTILTLPAGLATNYGGTEATNTSVSGSVRLRGVSG